ncbi:futalosine hydrolase [Bacteroidia bacterium]|nr:futalosine hydrolase [Bacteroidia bacterium]
MNSLPRILIVAATEIELAPLRQCLQHRTDIDFAVTGVGVLQTTYNLTRWLAAQHYQWAVCVGIAGSFVPHLQTGDVTLVHTERLDDLSNSQYMQGFEGAFARGLTDANQPPFVNEKLLCAYTTAVNEKLRFVETQSLTVSLLAQNAAQAQERHSFYGTAIETMEGAAFFYVCSLQNVPFVELRSISNRVGVADKAQWNVPLALERLAVAAHKLVEML